MKALFDDRTRAFFVGAELFGDDALGVRIHADGDGHAPALKKKTAAIVFVCIICLRGTLTIVAARAIAGRELIRLLPDEDRSTARIAVAAANATLISSTTRADYSITTDRLNKALI